jgi:hypothetical protein
MEKVATGGQGRSALTEACCCAARDDPSIAAEQRVRLAMRMRRGERVGIFMIFMRRTWIKAGP